MGFAKSSFAHLSTRRRMRNVDLPRAWRRLLFRRVLVRQGRVGANDHGSAWACCVSRQGGFGVAPGGRRLAGSGSLRGRARRIRVVAGRFGVEFGWSSGRTRCRCLAGFGLFRGRSRVLWQRRPRSHFVSFLESCSAGSLRRESRPRTRRGMSAAPHNFHKTRLCWYHEGGYCRRARVGRGVARIDGALPSESLMGVSGACNDVFTKTTNTLCFLIVCVCVCVCLRFCLRVCVCVLV